MIKENLKNNKIDVEILRLQTDIDFLQNKIQAREDKRKVLLDEIYSLRQTLSPADLIENNIETEESIIQDIKNGKNVSESFEGHPHKENLKEKVLQIIKDIALIGLIGISAIKMVQGENKEDAKEPHIIEKPVAVPVDSATAFSDLKEEGKFEMYLERNEKLAYLLPSDEYDFRTNKQHLDFTVRTSIATCDNDNQPTIAIDKNRGEIYLFDKNDNFIAASPVHLGILHGDGVDENVREKGILKNGVFSNIKATNTPAGWFKLSDRNQSYKYAPGLDAYDVYSVDTVQKDTVNQDFKLHGVPDYYQANFFSKDGLENWFRSHGCVRIPNQFLDIMTEHVSDGTNLYISPDFINNKNEKSN